MRFMVLFKANKNFEAGIFPDEKHLAELVKFNEELAKAGVLIAVDALHPSSKGMRVRFSGGKRMATDGPFAESKELIAGYWLWQVQSKEEALKWIERAPLENTEVEIRQVFEAEDLAAATAAGLPRGKELHLSSSIQPQTRTDMTRPAKNTICVWYDRGAEDAARFYARTFPDSTVGPVHHAPGDSPSGSKGEVLTVEFTVMGIPCIGLNGGPHFKQSEAFSFQVATVDQEETDRYWNAIVGNGGEESMCGWCKDKWGVSWQITPQVLTRAVMGPDAAAAKRAFDAMMTMKKIDIAAIEAAIRG
jgi:predicted 3-demethylubiquinone-9 3-methyltransferase (glyoxalase superfamily)